MRAPKVVLVVFFSPVYGSVVSQPMLRLAANAATKAALTTGFAMDMFKSPLRLLHCLSVEALVDVFHRIGEIFLGPGEFAAKLQHGAAAFDVHLRLLLETFLLREHHFVGLVRRRPRCAWYVSRVDRNGLGPA